MLVQSRWLIEKTLEDEYGIKAKQQSRFRNKLGMPFKKVGGIFFYKRVSIDSFLDKFEEENK